MKNHNRKTVPNKTKQKIFRILIKTKRFDTRNLVHTDVYFGEV